MLQLLLPSRVSTLPMIQSARNYRLGVCSHGCRSVDTYGNWGKEAHATFTRLATRLAICASLPKSSVIADLYGRLSLVLNRSIARAILARSLPQPFELVVYYLVRYYSMHYLYLLLYMSIIILMIIFCVWRGGDVVIRYNRRDEVFDLCHRAHLSVSVERGHVPTPGLLTSLLLAGTKANLRR